MRHLERVLLAVPKGEPASARAIHEAVGVGAFSTTHSALIQLAHEKRILSSEQTIHHMKYRLLYWRPKSEWIG